MERRIDQYLEVGYGSCHLRDTRVASMVADNLRFKDGTLYELWAWCIMPNHVHVLFDLTRGYDLGPVVHGWKSYSAHRALSILGCEPPFWQPEYYDRIVRDRRDLEDTREYVLDNPSRAGLENWPWVWARKREGFA